jgi:four helix bundle protein
LFPPNKNPFIGHYSVSGPGHFLTLHSILNIVHLTSQGAFYETENLSGIDSLAKGMDLVEEVYKASQSFPREEIYGLASQLRRAAVSIPSTIAEGQGRRTTPDFLRHLSIAYGSLLELETQLLIASRLNYLAQGKCSDFMNMAGEVGRLLNGLMSSLVR